MVLSSRWAQGRPRMRDYKAGKGPENVRLGSLPEARPSQNLRR